MATLTTFSFDAVCMGSPVIIVYSTKLNNHVHKNFFENSNDHSTSIKSTEKAGVLVVHDIKSQYNNEKCYIPTVLKIP